MSPRSRMPQPLRRAVTRGAALLAAMLTVTLVATFAAAAMWQQWRAVEIETAERARVQAGWLLTGALDWSRVILREDGRVGGADHLAEPWAIPLEEARLSSFLAAERNVSQVEDASVAVMDAFISGGMTDLQSRLNLNGLIQGGKPVPEVVSQFERLFDQLGLSEAQLQSLISAVQQAQAADGEGSEAPLMPPSFGQLGWLGVSTEARLKLAPYVTILPGRTPVNVNTADAEVLRAAIEGLDLAGAQKLLALRQTRHFKHLGELSDALGSNVKIRSEDVTVASSYFEVRGRLRLDNTVINERSIVRKQGTAVTTLWRQRGVAERETAAGTPQSGR